MSSCYNNRFRCIEVPQVTHPCCCPTTITNNPTNTNTFNPTINVNPVINIPPPGSGVIESAFRAEKEDVQDYPAISDTQVTYSNEIFDLNDEYDEVTSTFVPKQNGVYSICAGVFFSHETITEPITILLTIRVDSVERAQIGFNAIPGEDFTPRLQVYTITELQANQVVDVLVEANVSGTIQPVAYVSNFEAARFPSP
ncbi:hypothetical protein [Lysinibacillus xylanilyticus]|uniref:hypothetical protein n=1 Tax=Lysinibacillus xylanilyticus TaxID=582475 RepID=UPI0037FE3F3F